MRIQDQYPSIRIRSVWLILVVGCLLLQSCGGASPESDTDVSATVLENSDSLRYTLAANATADSPTGLQVIAITKLSTTKVSRTIYDYVFKVSIENSGEARTGVKASLIQAGKGSNIVDAEATIGNMGAKSFARSNDTITIRHDRTLAFDLTALKWVVASSRLESINETTLATVGVSDIQMINSTGQITMAAGGSERVGLHYNLAQGVIDSDIVWSVHADTKNVFKVIKGDSSLDITVNGSGLRDGDSAPLTLKVVRASTGQFAFYELSAAVVAADDQKTVHVSSQGTKVVTPLGDVTFSSNQLSTPVQATVTTVNLPGGGSRTQIRFDRAVENAGIRIKLPKVVNGDPATSAVTVQSAPRQALAAQRQSEIAAAETQCGVVRTTNGDYVTDGSGDKLGPPLFSRDAMFSGVTRIDNEEIALASTSGAGSTSVGGEISYTFDKAASGTLQAAISATSLETCAYDRLLSLVDWTSKEPVLFVHGFTAAKLFGGGQNTWVNFPKLAVRAFGMTPGLENQLVPFEFRWATDSDFKTAARDLGQVINYIYNRTGKKVHIIAHSFGGVLARTLLQDLAPDNTDSLGVGKMADAKAHVASLVTLGSPYSGIFANDTQVTLSSGTLNVPKGRDDWTLIGNCGQISCYQMGQDNAAFAGLGYVGDSARLGALTVQLAQTSNRLPNIPIHVGIGLTASAGRFGIGDDLISFAGQRFINPQTFDGAISAPLLDRTKVGAATVTETVLSGNASTRPGTAQQNSVDTTARPRGYAHTALTVSDGGSTFGYGLEAAPEYGCGGVVTCTHAGYRLFQEMIADAIRLSRPDAANTAAADPAKLVLNPAKLAQIDPSQIDALLPEMQAMLDTVRPYAQGSRIAWESVNNDLRLTRYKVILTQAFTNNNNAKLDQLFANRLAEMDTLNQFRAKAFADANSIFDPSPENIKLLADIVINSVKGGYAAARILVPAVNVTNSIAGPVKFASLQKHAEIVGKWKAMSGMVEFTDFMGGCGAASIQLLTTSLDTTPENLAGSDLANALVSVTKCVLTAIGDGASGVPGRGRVIAKFFGATIDYNGRKLSTWVILSGIISTLAEAVPPPPIPAISFVGAVADFINASATAIQAGGEMAENTNRAATMARFEVEALLDEVEKGMRARQLRALVAVRAESLFIISKQLPTVTATPSTLSAWDTVVWKISGAWQTVKSVVWYFGSGVGDYLTTAATKLVAAVVGGVSDAVEYVFQTSGSKTVTITYKDGANGGGNVVGFSSINVEVAANPSVAIAAVITSVKTSSGVDIPEAGSTSEQRPKLSGTLDAPLPNQFFVLEMLMDGTVIGQPTVTDTSWTFQPTANLLAGAHSFTVRVARGDTVYGAQSAPRHLTVVGVVTTPAAMFFDDFLGTAINTAVWTAMGTPTVNDGLVQFAANQGLSTKGKVSFSGERIVVEARMAGQGPSRDTEITIVDAATGEAIQIGDTTWCNWGFFAFSNRTAYSFTDAPTLACTANAVNGISFGGSTNQFMEYRITLNGNKITIERGASLTNLTQSATKTLGKSISGRSFYVVIRTGDATLSPATVDWIRVYTGSGILNPGNGHRYEIINCGTWTQCRDAAVAKGGNLVTVRSQAENDWLVTNVLTTASMQLGAWIGLERNSSGTWITNDGKIASYFNWSAGNPNNSGGDEFFGMIYSAPSALGYWNDANINGSGMVNQAIVEYINGDTITLDASQFSTGTNIAVNDDATSPCQHGLVYNAPPYNARPNAGEWVVVAPTAGIYSMAVAFAALDSRPVDILINGASALKGALSNTTGGWCASNVQNQTVGSVSLKAGANVVRLERTNVFPHLQSFTFVRQ